MTKHSSAAPVPDRARGSLLAAVGTLLAAGLATEAAAVTRTIDFAGREWTVKSEPQPLGPGPNRFSGSQDNVWVDEAGRLHLKITRTRDGWQCAEVIGTESLGYGTYSWTLASRVDALDPNAILGLYVWSDAPAFAHREIDIEFARWGDREAANAQYVVQPYRAPGHQRTFAQPPAATSRHSFTWSPGRVSFTSSTGSPGAWTYAARDVPPSGDERPRMNLWLLDGAAPLDGRPVEVVVRDFTFTPARPPQVRARVAGLAPARRRGAR